MEFQFDKIVDRRNTGSMKWDVQSHEMPIWVADMDFETAGGRGDEASKDECGCL